MRKFRRYVRSGRFEDDAEQGFEWITPFCKVSVYYIGGFYAAYVCYVVFGPVVFRIFWG